MAAAPLLVLIVANFLLLAALLLLAIGIVLTRRLLTAVMLVGGYSVLFTLWLMVMDAPDVAFTEAVVGAGASTIILLGAILLTRGETAQRNWRRAIAPALVVVAAGAALLYATPDMPVFGDPAAPANAYVGRAYLEQAGRDVGPPNVVTAVLASYRGFDTLGETVVIFAAAIAVALCLGLGERAMGQTLGAVAPRGSSLAESDHHVVLRVAAKFLIPIIAMLSFYVLFHGDLGAGGGFQGGVILSVAVILHALVFGLADTMLAIRPAFVRALAALGVLIYGGVGVATILNGGAYLDYDFLFPPAFRADLDGHHHWGQHFGVLIIEIGVMLTVSATMVSLFYAFAGRAPDAEIDGAAFE